MKIMMFASTIIITLIALFMEKWFWAGAWLVISIVMLYIFKRMDF